MLHAKFFHEALEAHDNRGDEKHERVEAVGHRMLSSRIMLAELPTGYGFRLVVQTGSDESPQFKVIEDIGDHSLTFDPV